MVQQGPEDSRLSYYKDALPNMDLVPSHLDLFTIDLELSKCNCKENLN